MFLEKNDKNDCHAHTKNSKRENFFKGRRQKKSKERNKLRVKKLALTLSTIFSLSLLKCACGEDENCFRHRKFLPSVRLVLSIESEAHVNAREILMLKEREKQVS